MPKLFMYYGIMPSTFFGFFSMIMGKKNIKNVSQIQSVHWVKPAPLGFIPGFILTTNLLLIGNNVTRNSCVSPPSTCIQVG
jgi:hypothetical protein